MSCFPGCSPGRFIARVAQASDNGYVGYLLLLFSAPKTSHSHVFLIQKEGAGLLTTMSVAPPESKGWRRKGDGLLLNSTVICSLLRTVAILYWTCSRSLVGKSVDKPPQQTAPLGNVFVVFLSERGHLHSRGFHREHHLSMACHEEDTGHGPAVNHTGKAAVRRPGAQQCWATYK